MTLVVTRPFSCDDVSDAIVVVLISVDDHVTRELTLSSVDTVW